mgnify:CR=1 FL=1
MKKSLVGIAFVAACATSPAPQSQDETAVLSFETAKLSLSAVKAAGEKCRVPARLDRRFDSCPVQPAVYDRQACLAFDDAIQDALKPIRTCAQLTPETATPEERAACIDYINHFLQPCIGVHALHLAYSEMAESQAFRNAIANGAEEATARERRLSDLVRYRD